MSPDLRIALGVSIGLHAAALAGWPVATPPQFDVQRAPTSVELWLVAPPAAAPAPAPDATPVEPEPQVTTPAPEEPAPQTLISPEERGAEIDVLPGYLRNPPPVYPRIARERGEEGTVLLEVEVLPSGRCGAINVLESSGAPALDEAALRAVRGWVFRPARRWRQPVAFWVEIPMTFRLVGTQQER